MTADSGGAAAFQATAYGVVGALAPPDGRARALAIVGAGGAIASVLGAPIGVGLGQLWGWRAPCGPAESPAQRRTG